MKTYIKWTKFFLFNKSRIFRLKFDNEYEREVAGRVARVLGYEIVTGYRKEGNVIYL